MLIRAGYYFGMAARILGDKSYAERWLGRAQEMTEADYMEATHEIQMRLVEAGLILPDEDPYERDWHA